MTIMMICIPTWRQYSGPFSVKSLPASGAKPEPCARPYNCQYHDDDDDDDDDDNDDDDDDDQDDNDLMPANETNLAPCATAHPYDHHCVI